MNFDEYLKYFESIVDTAAVDQSEPYNNEDYFGYTKLNWSRMNRWLKTGVLNEEIKSTVQSISQKQNWIVITEPWCGDAAHIVPWFELLSRENNNITIKYELRDSEPFRINQYLTNGKSKSIPILIVKNEADEDLIVWGPRPDLCQNLYQKLIEEQADFETLKTALQKWYNDNKGSEIQKELNILLKQTLS